MVRCTSTKETVKSSECLAQSTLNEFGRSDINNQRRIRRLKNCVWQKRVKWITTWGFAQRSNPLSHLCLRCQQHHRCRRFRKQFSANGQVVTESLFSGSRSPASTVFVVSPTPLLGLSIFLDPCLNRTQVSNPLVGNE